MRRETISLVFLVLFLVSIPLISFVSPNGNIQIEGIYKDLWNQSIETPIKDLSNNAPTLIAVDDISCDGKPDVVLFTKNDSIITLVALCGKNGTQLWIYNITVVDPIVEIYPVDDMTCDGKTDFIVMVNEISLSRKTLIAVGGKEGNELWNKTFSSTGSYNYTTVNIYPVDDISCDGKPDVILAIEWVNGTSYYDKSCAVAAIGLEGKTGIEVWRWYQKDDYCSILTIHVNPVDDLTCDGKPDVVITTYYNYEDYVYVLNGANGTELWNETNMAPGRMEVYPGYDLDGDTKTDVILVQSYSDYDRVRALVGKDKSLLWEKNVSIYPDQRIYVVDDLSCDGKPDIVFQGLHTVLEIDSDGDGFIDRWVYNQTVTALRGTDGTEVWVWTLNRFLISNFWGTGWDTLVPTLYPVGDISCDGKTDVLVYTQYNNYSSNVSTFTVNAIDGHVGEDLWNWSITTLSTGQKITCADIVTVDDMTCDGKNDFIIRIGLSSTNCTGYGCSGPPYIVSVVSLNGATGTVLWEKNSPLSSVEPSCDIIPVDDLSCDGKTDIILHMDTTTYDFTNYPLYTWFTNCSVTALVGKNGTQLWTTNISGEQLRLNICPTGDFSCDGKTDVILDTKDLLTNTSNLVVKEGKTGKHIINISSNNLTYIGLFFRLRIEYSNYGGNILYYWEKDYNAKYDVSCDNISDLIIGGGQEIYALTKLVPPQGDSAEGNQAIQNVFFTNEDVWAIGSGFTPYDIIDIYVFEDRDWTDGDPIPGLPGDFVRSVQDFQCDENGDVHVLVWSQPLIVGDYDIVYDANQNGTYEWGIDAVDGASPGFVVKGIGKGAGGDGDAQVPLLSSLHLAFLAILMSVVAVIKLLRKK